jgi:hypothetical protein
LNRTDTFSLFTPENSSSSLKKDMLAVVSPLHIIAIVLLVAEISAAAQAPNTDFKIVKIEPALVESPAFSGAGYEKRGAKPKSWLEVEVTFDWQPRLKEPKYTEELAFDYYILLNLKGPQNPQGTLLVGSVTHVSVPQGKKMHSAVYVSPRSLERLFGEIPSQVGQAVVDVGVTISKAGQPVAAASWKSRSIGWWAPLPPIPGFVLKKDETPFAPLAWDYFEPIKPKPPAP